MELTSRKELIFYYESSQNPNGDPSADNRTRIMRDGTLMVTDTRLKQTIREYAHRILGKTVLALHDTSDRVTVRAEKILQHSKLEQNKLANCSVDDVIENLLCLTYDVPLFGMMLPIGRHSEKSEDTNTTAKLAGSVQFELGRSVNKVSRISPQISGRFVGATDTDSSTLGKYQIMEYALIGFRGTVEPSCLEKYGNSDPGWRAFCAAEKALFECLWHGTTRLLTRSKYPQRPILYAEVEYSDRAMYDDLGELLYMEQKNPNTPARSAADFALKADGLAETLAGRKVAKFRIVSSHEHQYSVVDIIRALESAGIDTELLEDVK